MRVANYEDNTHQACQRLHRIRIRHQDALAEKVFYLKIITAYFILHVIKILNSYCTVFIEQRLFRKYSTL